MQWRNQPFYIDQVKNPNLKNKYFVSCPHLHNYVKIKIEPYK